MGIPDFKQVQGVIDSLGDEKKSYMNQYFKYAPDWIIEALYVQEFEENKVFIREGHGIHYVYFFLKGSVKATDYRIHGAMYDFMWFVPVKVFGGLETILHDTTYKTTLTTTAPSVMLVLPRNLYEKWLLSDVNALSMESNTVAHSLLKQTRRERVYLFLQGLDRMAYFLLHYYEQFQEDGKCEMKLTRQHMSDCTGLSIKTVNRSLVSLEESGCISRRGNRILISEIHYEELKRYNEELIE